jgi:diguanylate cyclase (GGDEF)-like protein
MPFDDDDLERTHVTTIGNVKELLSRAKRDRAYLIVLAGSNVGEMHKLDSGEVVLGRATTVQVRLSDDGVSRRHARLLVDQGSVVLEDLGSANGTLVNGSKVDRATLKDGDQIQLGGTTILKFSYQDSLEEDFQRKMYEAALRDPMTKAFNKKHLLDRMESELAFARRHAAPLALIMLDVDHFKKINDTHGHPAGDYVLVKLAQLIASTLRTEDVFARYGGEEFSILLRGTSLNQAEQLGERIRGLLEQERFEFDGVHIPVTVSVGVTALPERAAETALAFIGDADDALYAAKHSGRNRVVCAG